METVGQRSQVKFLFSQGEFCGTFLKKPVEARGLVLGGMVGNDLKLCSSRDGNRRSRVKGHRSSGMVGG